MTAPVETLREAARLMRERAEAATPGPWRADRNAVREEHGVALLLTYADAGPPRPTAEHIASWHPAVALAVADWLDALADDVNGDYGIPEGHRTVLDGGLAVAHAYLGQTS